MNQLIAQLERSIIDHYFSRSERKSLTELLQQKGLDDQRLNSLRKKIFTIAKNEIKENNYQAVTKWLEEVNMAISTNSSKAQKVFFSPGNDCRDTILAQLDNAKESIKICVFTISDNIITAAILKCYKKGVDVKIITDNDKTYDRGSDIEQMANRGVAIKIDNTSNHMHHKFMVVDNISAITGSYNWTRSAAERNHENIVLLHDSGIVNSYYDEFNALWEEMTPY